MNYRNLSKIFAVFLFFIVIFSFAGTSGCAAIKPEEERHEGKFICHSDFADVRPINVLQKGLKNQNSEIKYQNRHILFRKKFTLNEFSSAIIRITADDCFKLYLNGKFVTVGPPNGYPQRYYYMELDVSDFLKEGENVLAAHCYYQGLVNHVWVSADMRESFWTELIVDGKTAIYSDESFKCAEHTGFTALAKYGYDTAFGERYDSSAREVGFERPDYDDGYWHNASVYKNADYNLVKSPIKPLYFGYAEPVISKEREDGTLFLDFGQEMTGYLYAEATGEKGDKVILREAEELNDDGSIRFDMRCGCRYEEEWILSGKPDVLNKYDYKAFRYAEIVAPKGVKIKKAGMIIRHYPFKQREYNSVDNPELKKVLKLCENTIKYGVQEAYLDCMTREKGQYLGDLSVSGRAHVVLTGDTALIKKSLTDFCESTSICKGMIAVTGSSMNQEIADSSLLFPSIVAWVYSVDGDIDFVKYCEPYATGVYEYFKKYECADGLIGGVKDKWNLVDWPENLRDGYDFPITNPIGDGEHNVLNALYIGFLESLNEIYDICGKDKIEIGRYKESFVKAFYSESTGLFCDSRSKTHSAVHSNVLPLLFGIGTENEDVKNRIVDFICEKKLTSMGVYMAYMALSALVKNGEKEKAVSLATDKGAWLNMIEEGGTTTFEAWGKDQKWNTSLFHPWATAPIVIFNDVARVY